MSFGAWVYGAGGRSPRELCFLEYPIKDALYYLDEEPHQSYFAIQILLIESVPQHQLIIKY
jgi:hypothetical protein